MHLQFPHSVYSLNTSHHMYPVENQTVSKLVTATVQKNCDYLDPWKHSQACCHKLMPEQGGSTDMVHVVAVCKISMHTELTWAQHKMQNTSPEMMGFSACLSAECTPTYLARTCIYTRCSSLKTSSLYIAHQSSKFKVQAPVFVRMRNTISGLNAERRRWVFENKLGLTVRAARKSWHA